MLVIAIVGAVVVIGAGLIRPSPIVDSDQPVATATAQPSAQPSDQPQPTVFFAPPVDYADEPGQLAYTVGGVDAGVYLATAGGSGPRRIADRPDDTEFHGVEWSPDGRHLLYYEAGRVSRFHVTDPLGKVVFSGDGCCAAWTPDGTLLATLSFFGGSSDRNPGSAALVVVGLDGSPVAQVTLSGARPGNLVQVFWFPDGRSILVDDLYLGSGGSPSETWVIPIESGREPRPFPIKPLYGARSFFSPDGSRVVGYATEGLVVAAADGTGARVLAPNPAEWYASAWSPDGDRIALLLGRGEESPVLHVLDATTSETLSPLPSGLTAGLLNVAYIADWSPNDGRILFSTATGLWAVDPDGSDLRQLLDGVSEGRWQPLLAADR
jgi:Tol biopolymer transport system component